MQFSKFGESLIDALESLVLMDDLNDGLRTPGAIMLGGGNPAAIPACSDYFNQASADMLASGTHCCPRQLRWSARQRQLHQIVSGNVERHYGWDIA